MKAAAEAVVPGAASDSRNDDFLWLRFFVKRKEGEGLYLTSKYAEDIHNSHQNGSFASIAAPLFSKRIIDVLEGHGDNGGPGDI